MEETEYERYLQDQNEMLDKLYEDAENWLNQRLDNLDGLLLDIIKATNENSADIAKTLGTIAEKFGYDISDDLEDIFKNKGDAVSYYDDGFTDNQANTLGVIEEIRDFVKAMVANSNSEAGVNLRANNFATGSSYISRRQLAWTQEDGQELIYRSSDGAILTPLGKGDMVFTSDMSRILWEIAQNPSLLDGITTTATAIPRGIINNGSNNIQNDVTISVSLPGVTNYEEFRDKIIVDKKIEKSFKTMLDPLNNNSLNKFRY